jgi:hypothetical protein
VCDEQLCFISLVVCLVDPNSSSFFLPAEELTSGPTISTPAQALVHLWRAAMVMPRPFPVLPWYLFTHRFPPAPTSLLGSDRWDASGTHLLRHAWAQQIIATWQHVRAALPMESDVHAHPNSYAGSVQWRVFDAVRLVGTCMYSCIVNLFGSLCFSC